MVESLACYRCEVWLLKREEQWKFLALEMDYLTRSNPVSRLQKISYITIRSKIQLESKEGELKWYGNLLRMDGNRWPKMIYQWSPHGK